MGLKAIPMRAETGPIGGDLSHEFIILADTGESEVFADRRWMETDVTASGVSYSDRERLNAFYEDMTSLYAATDDIHDPENCPVTEDELTKARGIEVGHIFYFGTKYSDPLNAKVQNMEGEYVPVHMGSYGVGVSRLVGAIIEASHDDAGIIWPEEVAPFKAGIININAKDQACHDKCMEIYKQLTAQGIEVLYDDRNERAGAKFADMDLIGLPWQVAIGPKGLANGTAELKNRKTGEKQEISISSALEKLAA